MVIDFGENIMSILTLPAKKSPASKRSVGGEMNWRSFYT